MRYGGGALNSVEYARRAMVGRLWGCIEPFEMVGSCSYVTVVVVLVLPPFPVSPTHIYTRGALPRRANARLGSAHARNYRGCMICIIGKNRRCKCDSTVKGYIENKSYFNEEKENTGIRCNEPQQQTLPSSTR